MRPLILAAAALLLGQAAGAAPLPDFVKDTVGDWLVVTDDGKPGCRIALKSETAKGGWRASPAADCASRLPVVGRAAAWNFDGGVRLLGADGKVLLDFQEDETTLMKTSFETPPVYFIVKAPAAVDRAPFAPALVGEWRLRRPDGSAKCPLTISKGKDADADLAVKAGAPCDAPIARLKLSTARVEDVRLILYGARDTALELQASGSESYATVEGKPLILERPR